MLRLPSQVSDRSHRQVGSAEVGRRELACNGLGSAFSFPRAGLEVVQGWCPGLQRPALQLRGHRLPGPALRAPGEQLQSTGGQNQNRALGRIIPCGS